jgi:hypothetical protein
MVQVSIRFVDGGFQEYSESSDFLLRLTELQNQGHEGRALINALISDDWGAPPLCVQIKGKGLNGSEIDLQITYD